jgi:Amt family ammonium transporter
MHKRKVSVVGAAAGSIAGLVAITPASGYVTAGGAVIIGILAGGVCYSAILLRERLKVDDALDVWAVHGVGGTLGAIATGVFAVAAIGGVKGAIEGNVAQVGTQLVAVAATWAFAGISTFVIIKAIDIVLGLRVAPSDEEMGLDLALHGEAAYQT